jgi:lysophospholipase L1-like esterase
MHKRLASAANTLLISSLVLSSLLMAVSPASADEATKQAAQQSAILNNWPNFSRYRSENALVPPPKPGEKRVVFLGDSITDYWGRRHGVFFPGKPYLNRGIGGQTTAQMLLRFQSDVVALSPAIVVIEGGSNDLRLGAPDEQIEAHLASLTQLASANGIRVVLASLTPVCDCFVPRTPSRPLNRLRAINAWIRKYTERNGYVYLDYWTPLADSHGMMRREYTVDGVHPNDAGYAPMAIAAEQAIRKAEVHSLKK